MQSPSKFPGLIWATLRVDRSTWLSAQKRKIGLKGHNNILQLEFNVAGILSIHNILSISKSIQDTYDVEIQGLLNKVRFSILAGNVTTFR